MVVLEFRQSCVVEENSGRVQRFYTFQNPRVGFLEGQNPFVTEPDGPEVIVDLVRFLISPENLTGNRQIIASTVSQLNDVINIYASRLGIVQSLDHSFMGFTCGLRARSNRHVSRLLC
jgi:hypothetical protein